MINLYELRRELKRYNKALQYNDDSIGCIIKGNIVIIKANRSNSLECLGVPTITITINTKSIITNDIAVLKLMLDNLSKYDRNQELKRVLKLS